MEQQIQLAEQALEADKPVELWAKEHKEYQEVERLGRVVTP
jgi:hypothetical protein